jgi:hypothetical protein
MNLNNFFLQKKNKIKQTKQLFFSKMDDDLTRTMTKFFNPSSYGMKEKKFERRFKGRFMLLKRLPIYKTLSRDIFKIPSEHYRHLPQDDKRWLQLRGMPRITGSVLGKLLLMHEINAGKYIDISDSMYDESEFNDEWETLRLKIKYGYLPSTPMEPPGNVFCANGTWHEPNVLGTLLEAIPSMTYRECGLIIIGKEQLDFFKPWNVFENNELITELPFEMGGSADFDCDAPSFIKVEKDGSKTYGEMISMSGEAKCSTVVFPDKEEKTDFYMMSYTFMRYCKPHPKPKTYYIPQKFNEMFCLMRNAGLFASWTYKNGMNVWKFKMVVEYLSLMLSILIHLYKTFTAKDLPVPNNYFWNHPNYFYRKTFMRFLDMTNDMSRNAEVYMTLSGEETSRITEEIGVVNKNSYVNFPEIPEGVYPVYAMLQVYGYRYYKDYERLFWVFRSDQVDARISNINMLCDTALTSFCAPLCNAVMNYFVPYDPETHELHNIKNRVMENAETLLLDVYMLIGELYGNPKFGEPLDVQLFYDNLLKVYWNEMTGMTCLLYGVNYNWPEKPKHDHEFMNEYRRTMIQVYCKEIIHQYCDDKDIDLVYNGPNWSVILKCLDSFECVSGGLLAYEMIEKPTMKNYELAIASIFVMRYFNKLRERHEANNKEQHAFDHFEGETDEESEDKDESEDDT